MESNGVAYSYEKYFWVGIFSCAILMIDHIISQINYSTKISREEVRSY